jgi:hypothetical protein
MIFQLLFCILFLNILTELITSDEVKIISQSLSEKEKTESLGIALSAIGLSNDTNIIADNIVKGLTAQFGSHWNCFITTDRSKANLKIQVINEKKKIFRKFF